MSSSLTFCPSLLPHPHFYWKRFILQLLHLSSFHTLRFMFFIYFDATHVLKTSNIPLSKTHETELKELKPVRNTDRKQRWEFMSAEFQTFNPVE